MLAGATWLAAIGLAPAVRSRQRAAARKLDSSGVESAPRRKSTRDMTDAELRALYPGFEGIVIDHPSEARNYRCTTILHTFTEPGDVDAFVKWCRRHKIKRFEGFSQVWQAYEQYCFEEGFATVTMGAFQRRFNKLCSRTRPRKQGGRAVRPMTYQITKRAA
jgi:hypothetical protein